MPLHFPAQGDSSKCQESYSMWLLESHQTWPSHGSSQSQWFSNGGAYCCVPTPHAQIRRELGLSLQVLGVWLWNHLSRLLSLFGVLRPEASMPLTVPPPTMSPPPRSFLPVGIGGWYHSDTSTSWSEPSQRPRPVNTRGQLTPEACQRLRPVNT